LSETTEAPSPEPEGDSVETTTQKSEEEGVAEPESNYFSFFQHVSFNFVNSEYIATMN
jgi:hypothetical protein